MSGQTCSPGVELGPLHLFYWHWLQWFKLEWWTAALPKLQSLLPKLHMLMQLQILQSWLLPLLQAKLLSVLMPSQ
jgi:hypothetical protein